MFKRGLWRICWGLGAVFKAGSDFVAFVAKRQERLDKAPPFHFFPGCVSVSSLVALEIDDELELFEGFFEFAAAGVVRHDCLRSLCLGELMFALHLGDIKLELNYLAVNHSFVSAGWRLPTAA